VTPKAPQMTSDAATGVAALAQRTLRSLRHRHELRLDLDNL
jgi:hypothetical protein